MKRLLALLALTTCASAATGATVVNYDDGSTYTLTEGQSSLYQYSNSL